MCRLTTRIGAAKLESSAQRREIDMSIHTLRDSEAVSSSDLHADPARIREGMGVTMRTGLGGLYTPFTVIAVKRNGRELVIQRDKTVLDGENTWADEAPRHYESDPNGRVETITL